MKIAIASGKGGTGKTTLATNLAFVLAGEGARVAYLDCDVEEPNGHIFLKPVIHRQRQVTIPVPEVDETRCTFCRACGEACRYSAILALRDRMLTFPRLCHGCGGCLLACPEKAIREVPRSIGTIEEGIASPGIAFIHGRLDVGEAMSPPVIRAVRSAAPAGHDIIVDAPPGTSCPVIESVRGVDVVLLVTEPTPFGLSDLKLAADMVRELRLPFGVAVNRVGMGTRDVFSFCDREGIPVLLEMADDRRVAEAYSRGELVARAFPDLKERLIALLPRLRALSEGPRPPEIEVSKQTVEWNAPEKTPSQATRDDLTSGPRELVVVSGKGGTGKTSIVASLFALAGNAAVADCDVDAADLHLVLDPRIQGRWPFSGGNDALIDPEACSGCGVCMEHCRFDAIHPLPTEDRLSFHVDRISCEGCGVCTTVCPEQAVRMVPARSGEWFVSETRHGPMVHARLGIAQQNSGKLVSLVRCEARAMAVERGRNLLLIDGSPGIGCPVIASVTGAHAVLVVTEPTLSGLHDMKRVIELTRHFHIKTAACVNKADINPELADRLCREAEKLAVPVLGRIRYDPEVTRAQVMKTSVVESGGGMAAEDIQHLWERLGDVIG